MSSRKPRAPDLLARAQARPTLARGSSQRQHAGPLQLQQHRGRCVPPVLPAARLCAPSPAPTVPCAAGIFGENAIQVPKVDVSTIGQHNTSSVQGGAGARPCQLCARPAVHWAPPTLCAPGIFAEPQPLQPTPRTSQLTASSIQGGLFFDEFDAIVLGEAIPYDSEEVLR